MTPERIGRFRITGSLGAGGMGHVYDAVDELDGSRVAVKVLSVDPSGSAGHGARFHREVETLTKLDHPNIVAIIDHGYDESAGAYYAMEYIDGLTVTDLIAKRGAMAWPGVVALALQLCDGLRYAHDLGVIHRDLKPSNLLTSSGGRLKIVDFGIARRWGDSTITQTGAIIGTPDFMSPEQARSESVGVASDVYGVGAVMYAMLTGRAPFEHPAPYMLLKMIQERPPLALTELDATIPIELEQLVLSCLAKHPDERPRNVFRVKRDLEWIQQRANNEELTFRDPPKQATSERETLLENGTSVRSMPVVNPAERDQPATKEFLMSGRDRDPGPFGRIAPLMRELTWPVFLLLVIAWIGRSLLTEDPTLPVILAMILLATGFIVKFTLSEYFD